MKTVEVMWQGTHGDVLDIQHLLYAFDAQIAQHQGFLSINLPGAKLPLILGLGDTVVVNDLDQMSIKKRED